MENERQTQEYEECLRIFFKLKNEHFNERNPWVCKDFREASLNLESMFRQINQDIIVPLNGVEVYHKFRTKESFYNALNQGLKTRNQLVHEGVLDARGFISHNFAGSNRDDVVYFKYSKDIECNNDNYWISILVDPDKAIVHNSELRVWDPDYYFDSSLILSEYILNIKQVMEKNKQDNPEKTYISQPYTARPFKLDFEHLSHYPLRRYLLNGVGYNCNEICIPKTIKPCEFYRASHKLADLIEEVA